MSTFSSDLISLDSNLLCLVSLASFFEGDTLVVGRVVLDEREIDDDDDNDDDDDDDATEVLVVVVVVLVLVAVAVGEIVLVLENELTALIFSRSSRSSVVHK